MTPADAQLPPVVFLGDLVSLSGQSGTNMGRARAKPSPEPSVCAADGLLNEVRQIAAALSESGADNSSPGCSMLGIT